MSESVQDLKLKNLIQACKENGNYKKLAVVSFILTSNKMDEIGIKLGVRPRAKNKEEKLFEYATLINNIFNSNIGVSIFKQELIEEIRRLEIPFLQRRGDIPLDYIRPIFEIYFDLRELKIPNLSKQLKSDTLIESQLEYYNFLSGSGSSRKKKDSSNLKPLIIQKLKEKENALQRDLEYELNPEKLERAIHLQAIRNSLDRKGNHAVVIQGTLKQNLVYQNSIEGIFKYLLFGLMILTFSLGMIVLIECSFFPSITSARSPWTLFFFGLGALLVLLYLKQFRKRG